MQQWLEARLHVRIDHHDQAATLLHIPQKRIHLFGEEAFSRANHGNGGRSFGHAVREPLPDPERLNLKVRTPQYCVERLDALTR